jgi:hypothetical protein
MVCLCSDLFDQCDLFLLHGVGWPNDHFFYTFMAPEKDAID